MRLSVVIPAYNASEHINKALKSIYAGFDQNTGDEIEVIVVDDGSNDSEKLKRICDEYQDVTLIRHEVNRGMCSARNSGIAVSSAEYLTLLDADDEFVTDWYNQLQEIINEWPVHANVCFTPCINERGIYTCAEPGYRGWMTAEDMIKERYSGEYNPIFRGDYIRTNGYEDLGMRKSCGLLTYLRMIREASFWISDRVMRIYHDSVEQSVTYGWTNPDKAAETMRCYVNVLKQHGDFIRDVDSKKYKEIYHKLLIYKMLSLEGRDLAGLWHKRCWSKSWFITLLLLLVGATGTARLLGTAKRMGLVKRYG